MKVAMTMNAAGKVHFTTLTQLDLDIESSAIELRLMGSSEQVLKRCYRLEQRFMDKVRLAYQIRKALAE